MRDPEKVLLTLANVHAVSYAREMEKMIAGIHPDDRRDIRATAHAYRLAGLTALWALDSIRGVRTSRAQETFTALVAEATAKKAA
jgi:hypothetical protein